MGVTTFSSPSKLVSVSCRRHDVHSWRLWSSPSKVVKRKPCSLHLKRQAAGYIEATAVSHKQDTQSQPASGLQLAIAAHEIPHPAKASYGGEDAYFVSEQNGFAFGVADGVGGWANSGINPAEYSKTLMAEAQKHLESIIVPSTLADSATAQTQSSDTTGLSETSTSTQPETSTSSSTSSSSRSENGSSTSESADSTPSTSSSELTSAASDWSNFTPQTAIAAAHKATKQPGSSTACVLQLRPGSSILTAANLGDSGFAVFRQGQLAFQTNPLQHFFDCPYQLASCPDYTQDTDRAEDASLHQLQLEASDVIVLATDGLWDNLDAQELLTLLPNSAQEVEQAATSIAKAASHNAHDEKYSSPYAKEALKQGMDLPWWEKVLGTRIKDGRPQLATLQGGKVDDITVIVAFVGKA